MKYSKYQKKNLRESYAIYAISVILLGFGLYSLLYKYWVDYESVYFWTGLAASVGGLIFLIIGNSTKKEAKDHYWYATDNNLIVGILEEMRWFGNSAVMTVCTKTDQEQTEKLTFSCALIERAKHKVGERVAVWEENRCDIDGTALETAYVFVSAFKTDELDCEITLVDNHGIYTSLFMRALDDHDKAYIINAPEDPAVAEGQQVHITIEQYNIDWTAEVITVDALPGCYFDGNGDLMFREKQCPTTLTEVPS